MGIYHAEYEQTDAGGDNGTHFQSEEPSELVRTKEGEGEMAEPINEESNHLLGSEAHGNRDVIGYIGEMRAKDCREHIDDEARPNIH